MQKKSSERQFSLKQQQISTIFWSVFWKRAPFRDLHAIIVCFPEFFLVILFHFKD